MNLQSKCGNCSIIQTLIIGLCLIAGRNYGETGGQTDRRTNGRTLQFLDGRGGPFRPGPKRKRIYNVIPTCR